MTPSRRRREGARCERAGRETGTSAGAGGAAAPDRAYAQSQPVHGTLRAPDGMPVTRGYQHRRPERRRDWEGHYGQGRDVGNLPTGAGGYTITLDVASLPACLSLRGRAVRHSMTSPSPAGESRTVIFQLTETWSSSMFGRLAPRREIGGGDLAGLR